MDAGQPSRAARAPRPPPPALRSPARLLSAGASRAAAEEEEGDALASAEGTDTRSPKGPAPRASPHARSGPCAARAMPEAGCGSSRNGQPSPPPVLQPFPGGLH